MIDLCSHYSVINIDRLNHSDLSALVNTYLKTCNISKFQNKKSSTYILSIRLVTQHILQILQSSQKKIPTVHHILMQVTKFKMPCITFWAKRKLPSSVYIIYKHF